MSSVAIACDDVRRRYRRRGGEDLIALDGVSWRVDVGTWVALLGPNGSGKSTLVRLLTGLERGEGHVEVLGASPGVHAGRVGVVFQRPSLDGLLTVRENLRAQAALFGLSGGAAGGRIDDVARLVGIEDWLDDRVKTLSGGLARRADLARALVHEPELLVLDEATSGLDLSARQAFMDGIGSLRSARLTIVMTTHLMDEAERADRVVMLSEGRVVADDAPGALRSSCGEHLLRCADSDGAREALTSMQVRAQDGMLVCAVEPAMRSTVMARLAEAGVSFEFGPPTLGDAYLALTGRSLDGDGS